MSLFYLNKQDVGIREERGTNQEAKSSKITIHVLISVTSPYGPYGIIEKQAVLTKVVTLVQGNIVFTM